MTPKIIHQIVGPKPSPLVIQCLNSWQVVKDHDFEIRLWNDDLLQSFISTVYPSILPAFLSARNFAEAADIARYLIIYHFGGYYFDWDIELLNINEFLDLAIQNPYGYLVQDPINQTFASEAFSGMPGEDYLYKLVDNISYIHANRFRDSLKTPHYSGPYRMREVYYFIKKTTQQNIIEVKDIFLYDYREIRQKPIRNKEVAMIHYWEHSWMK